MTPEEVWLLRLQTCMAAMGWKVLVADESHTLRTSRRPPDALHAEAFAAAARQARRIVFLSGTPSLNRPFDLWLQVRSRPEMKVTAVLCRAGRQIWQFVHTLSHRHRSGHAEAEQLQEAGGLMTGQNVIGRCVPWSQ